MHVFLESGKSIELTSKLHCNSSDLTKFLCSGAKGPVQPSLCPLWEWRLLLIGAGGGLLHYPPFQVKPQEPL